ncbi:alpha/beta-hydrolase [Phlegmacium glaucopus]|nr:alpha/beta-hydrolase [Phlegmacium glaucopus]
MDSIPPSKEIPAAFTQSIRSWWQAGQKQGAISEQRLLRRTLPFLDAESSIDGPVIARSSLVQLDTPKRYLNTLSITATATPSSPPPSPAVLLHGYGAGLAFFFHNFPSLAKWVEKCGSSVYAIDWLGMGRSARVPFQVKAKREDVYARVTEAESFFIDSLEEWRKKMGLSQMTLIGHSLGAYFSVAYALRYPDRVTKLILLSPAGVPRAPIYDQLSIELPDKVNSQPESTPESRPTRPREVSSLERATTIKLDSIRQQRKKIKPRESNIRRLFTYLWEEGWSPFQVVRSTFFWSPMLIGKYSSRRFSNLTPEERRDMHDYIMNITLAKGSGEYCITHILEPSTHARMPLVDRIANLRKDMHVTFVYGAHDWMDKNGGEQSVEALKKAGNRNGRVHIVDNAGHHVYLDNVKRVDDILIRELDR